MPVHSLDKSDRFLLVMSLVGTILFTTLLLREDLLLEWMTERYSGEVIGKVVEAKNDVRRRVSQSLSWYDTSVNADLYERDTLYTGHNSKMTIALLGDQRIYLDENSLVALQTKGNEILIDLQLGSVASYANKAQPIKVLHEGRVTEINADSTAAPVIIKKSARGDLRITSRAGGLEVSIGDDKKRIEENESLRIDLDGLKVEGLPDRINLVYPVDRAQLFENEVFGSDEKRTVHFRWEAIDGAQPYVIEVAKDPEFTEPLRSEKESVAVKTDLTQGTYYWRVLSKSKPNLKSEVFEFTLGIEQPTEFYGPPRPPTLNASAPEVAKAPEKVQLKFKPDVDARSPASIQKALLNPPRLEWQPLAEAREYVLEVDTTAEFQKPKRYENLKSPMFIWQDPKPGQYYWRVKARGYLGEETNASAPRSLEVTLPSPDLKPPDLEDETTDQPKSFKEPKVAKLVWDEVPMAQAYKVVAGRESRIVNGSEIAFKIPPNKQMEVKVAALDDKGQQVSEFASMTFGFKRELVIAAPEIVLPEDRTTVVAFDKQRMDPLLFAWKSSAGAKGYELQFAADPEFKKVLNNRFVSSNKFILKDRLSDKTTYWRVRARFDDRVSSWSQPRSYEIQISGN